VFKHAVWRQCGERLCKRLLLLLFKHALLLCVCCCCCSSLLLLRCVRALGDGCMSSGITCTVKGRWAAVVRQCGQRLCKRLLLLIAGQACCCCAACARLSLAALVSGGGNSSAGQVTAGLSRVSQRSHSAATICFSRSLTCSIVMRAR
jgi:hypothetical protein